MRQNDREGRQDMPRNNMEERPGEDGIRLQSEFAALSKPETADQGLQNESDANGR